jgi:uncharacterized membrane protein YbhN (UPF0104 family)
VVRTAEVAPGSPASTAGAARRRALRIAGLLAVVAGAALAARKVDLSQVRATLAGTRPGPLALAALANLGSIAAHAGRWRAVVRAPGVRVRYRDALLALAAGFAAGIALPARGADVVRAHLLARRTGLSTASLLVASALDYVLGAAALVALAAALVAFVPLPAWAERGLAALALLAALAAGAAWLLRPRRGGRPGDGIVSRLRAGLAAVHEPGALAAALVWAAAGWTAEVAIALAALAAVGLPATLASAALAVLAASAAAAVQLAPGNAGTFELATALAVSGTGAPAHAALAFALVFHLAHLAPVALLGGVALLRETLAREG